MDGMIFNRIDCVFELMDESGLMLMIEILSFNSMEGLGIDLELTGYSYSEVFLCMVVVLGVDGWFVLFFMGWVHLYMFGLIKFKN